MSAEALIGAVEQSMTAAGDSGVGRFDVSSDVFEQFDARLENLHWREAADGALLVGDDQFNPSVVVRVALEGAELVAGEADPEEVSWERADVLSAPGTETSPQFD